MANVRRSHVQTRGAGEAGILDQFMSPEAMLTPGIAGALVMAISNSLSVNFELSRAYTGLALSFIFGLLAIAAARRWWVKIVYYILNSLIIFCVAFGANGVGVGVSGTEKLAFEPVSVALAQVRSDTAERKAPSSSGGDSSQPKQPASPKREGKAPTRQKEFFKPWTFR